MHENIFNKLPEKAWTVSISKFKTTVGKLLD